MLDESTVKRWEAIRDSAAADTEWQESYQRLVALRLPVQQAIVALTSHFVNGRIDAEALRRTFDIKTRVEWVGFGLKGMSYAMFLNKLLKYLGDEPTLADQLRATLQLPNSRHHGYVKLRDFYDWLQLLIKKGITTRKALQPARAASFVSAFWHMQKPDEWPIYYESARVAFERDQLVKSGPDVPISYSEFRDTFCALAGELHIDSWTLEQLCHRQPRDVDGTTLPAIAPPTTNPASYDGPSVNVSFDYVPEDVAGHTHVQWLLATLGRQLGCQVWIATNDRSKTYEGETLGSLSLDTLPRMGLSESVSRALGYVDVLWLKGSRVHAAFEVEHTTSIYSGLLRMSDLVVATPNLTFRIYIVAPQERLRFVEQQLRRPSFQMLELHKVCGILSEEALLKEHASLLRWATDPSVVDRLAIFVNDVDTE